MDRESLAFKEFLALKERASKLLEKEGVDGEISRLIRIINSSNHYFTTSSCSGRVVLMEIDKPGMKRDARFLGKWHNRINLEEIKEKMSRARKGIVWFFAQPPIIHVVVDELKNAQKLVRMGIASGFKNSVLKSIEKKIVVELASTERFDIPLGRDGKFFCGEAYLSLLCDIGNELLKRSKMKIKKLEEAFARI